MPAKKDTLPTTTRTCLKCNKEFSSIGVGNRICGKCNTRNNRYSAEPISKNPYAKPRPASDGRD